jgi:hypothetical protein
MTGDRTTGVTYITRSFTPVTETMTRSAYLRRVSNNFFSFGDVTIFAIFYLLTRQLGSKYANVVSSITPWRVGWYRCTITTTLSTATQTVICVVSSETAPRGGSKILATFVYVAGPQLKESAFATSYIPKIIEPVTRAGDFASIKETILPHGTTWCKTRLAWSFKLFSKPMALFVIF